MGLKDGGLQEGEDVSLDETLSLAKISETAAGEAQTAASMARMFIQMKILEVKRFSAGPGGEATAKLMNYQKELEAATQRLAELRANVAKRKRLALVREAEAQVAGA